MNARRLASQRFPYVPLRINIGTEIYDVEALLDTGFDGALILPGSMIPRTLTPTGMRRWALADGSVVRAPYYRSTVTVGPFGPFTANVSSLGDEVLVGLSVAKHLKITLDHGRELIVEA